MAEINSAQDADKSGEGGRRIAVTVKLSPADYKRLRLFGVNSERSNQDIAETAILEYLASKDA